MTTANDYIRRVLDVLPSGTPLRSQIAMELNGHIAERLAHGHSLQEVLRLLGEPRALAESYLAAVPLTAASFLTRTAAKVLDIVTVMVVVALPVAAFAWYAIRENLWPFITFAGLIALVGGSILFAVYTAVAETWYGRTLGKRLLGLRVVTETGTRIGFGQAVVRQVPMFLQFYYIDVLFALFTERSQRAFEMLSKTRVVLEPAATKAQAA